MGPDRSHRGTAGRSRLLLAAALALALALAAIARAAAPSPSASAAQAEQLSSAIAGSARQARVRLAPGASSVAKALPGAVRRIDSLRKPAATTEEQLSVALGQLQQMSTLTYDPHYLPALLAVGRAYLAASGADPLTGTAVDPEYTGLGRELAASRTELQRSAARAASLSQGLRALSASLAREKRRSSRLATALDRLRRDQARR
jgi:hypothetical protein